MPNIKRDITRVNMNLPTELVEQVKLYADRLGLNVTSAYTVLINMALEQKKAFELLPELMEKVDKISNNQSD